MYKYVSSARDVNGFYAALSTSVGYSLKSMSAPQDTVYQEFDTVTEKHLYEVAYFIEIHDDARILVSFKDGQKTEFIFEI